MTNHSFVKHDRLLKLFEFLQTHFLGTSTPLQADSSNQGNSSSTQHTQALRQLQQTYHLERRCFL